MEVRYGYSHADGDLVRSYVFNEGEDVHGKGGKGLRVVGGMVKRDGGA